MLEKGRGKNERIEERGEMSQYEAKDLVMAMAQVAVEKADVGTLERLVELRKQMKVERAKEEFYQALTAFQSELKPIKKSRIVKNKDSTVKYSYATFDDIIESIQPLLEKHGLSYRFETEFEDKSVSVKCVITHLLGHQEVTSFKTVIEYSGRMLPIQEWGSALTYAKRYSLSLALGLATEEDTDANVEVEETPSQNESKLHEKKEPVSEAISYAQKGYIGAILQKRGWKHEDAMKIISDIVGREVNAISNLNKEEASRVITKLKEEPF